MRQPRNRYGAWAQLLALFRAVYGGSRHPQLKIPARKLRGRHANLE